MFWLSVAGGIFLIWLVLVFLFTPGINYRLGHRTSIHDKEFLYTLQSTCQAALHHGNRVTVFTNGVAFYPAMLETISQATHSINMELYIFQPGKIADQFVTELSAKARQGVIVTIVVDWLGSVALWGRPVRRLRKAGCRIQSYQSPRWYSLARLNNRTHRELLVADGRIAFIGGAGIADWWGLPTFKRLRWHKPWRDTMARIEGPVVAALQGVAAENWLECCGEIITGPDYFPNLEGRRRHDGVRREELPVGSRHRVAGHVPAPDGSGRSKRPDQHAVFPARPRAAPRAVRNGPPRREDQRHRPGAEHRSEMGAPGEPAHVG